MLTRIALCAALLAIASVASAAPKAPPVGAVYVKSTTDCFDMNDENGFPMCVMQSSGGAYDTYAPYRKVTSMALPYGRYAISGKVLYDNGGNRPLEPWAVVECVLEDGTANFIDYTSDNWGGHTEWWYSGGERMSVNIALSGGTALVLDGVLDVRAANGATVSISCRVQGQARGMNADGSTYWPVPIQNIRFHTSKIVATSVPSINTR